MKNLFISLVTLGALLTGCDKDTKTEAPLPELKITTNDPAAKIAENGRDVTIAVDKNAVSIVLAITTNADTWTLSEEIPAWIEATPSGDNLSLSIEENEAVNGRNGELKISVENKGGTLSATISISQAGVAAATLDLSDTKLNIPAAGGSSELGITTNQSSVNVQESEDWLTSTHTADKITFTADANTTGTPRSAEVAITAGGGDNTATKTVTVSQDTQVTLVVSNKNITIQPEGGSEEVTITSNHETIKIAIEDSWLSHVKDGSKVTFTADANNSNTARTTEVTVTAGEGEKTTTEVITVSQNILVKSLTYVIKTTAADKAVGLPTLTSTDAAISIKVDYGDGSAQETFTTSVTSANKHIYVTPGEYTVTILTDNVITAFVFGHSSASAANTSLYKVENNSLDMSGVKTLANCFRNCSLLASVAANTFSGCVNATNGEYLFDACKALTAIPTGLVSKLTKVTSFNYAFRNCSALSAIPAGMFSGFTTVKTLNNAFMNTSITEVPSKLFAGCTAITGFTYTFNACKQLTAIAADAFEGCSKVTDFYAVFTDCSKLVALPDGMFSHMTALSDISYSFQGCSALTSLPATMFDKNRNLSSFDYAFMNCTALEGESPYTMINGQKVHLYERELYPDDFRAPYGDNGCFRNDELLTDFAAIVQKSWN